MIKKILKAILKLLILLIILFGLFLAYFTIFDYQPEEKITIFENKEKPKKIKSKKFSLLIWNIGYAGLGDDMDFFYGGGEKTRCSKERTIENLTAIIQFIENYDYVDFILLQEIDINSKRTYYINELDSVNKILDTHIPFYATNYKVQYVPVPIFNSLGYVDAGLATYSKYAPITSTRYSFPGNYSWPTKLFMLDRCFICNRYTVKKDKELIIINTHNSAFDKTGNLRTQQMEYLKEFISEEYNKGNFVIVGGDWNQNPPNFNKNNFADNREQMLIKNDFMPKDWEWVFDSTLATNRSMVTEYISDNTSTTIIDFYLISPNIKSLNCETVNLNFKNSDHQPVFLEIKLKY